MIKTLSTLLALGMDPKSPNARALLTSINNTRPAEKPKIELTIFEQKEEEEGERWDGMG